MVMNDENMLLVAIKNGDEDAFGMLLEEYRRMIYKIINGFDLEVCDYLIEKEELFQEASLALYQAVKSYEFDRSVKFSSFAYTVIYRKMVTTVKRYRHIYEDKYSLDADKGVEYRIAYITHAVADNPEAYHKEKEFEMKLQRFIDELPKKDKELLRLKQEDLSYKEMGKRLNMKSKTIDNRLRCLKRRFYQQAKIKI